MQESFIFWGGSLKELKKYFLETGKIISIEKISPLECEVSIDILKTYGITRVENKNVESHLAYTEILKKINANYLLVDMGCVFKEQKETIDTLWDLEDSILYSRLDVFIDAVRTYFPASHVLLLRYHIPDYKVMAGEYLKDEDVVCPDKKEKLAFVSRCEDYFIKKVHCINIPLMRSYFRKKNKGTDSRFLFEDECYIDISNKLVCYVNGNCPAVNFNRADFSISLKRYSTFYYDTICVKAFGLFLNCRILTELFVVSSTKETVEYYQNELLELDNDYNWRKPELCIPKLEAAHFTGKKKEIICLLKALWCVENKELEKADMEYVKKLFRLATVTNKTLGEIRTEYQRLDQTITPKDITPFNAGYYFAILNCDMENASQYMNSEYMPIPVRMDVFGSCVSRVCLNERYSKKNNIVVPNLWWHVPPYRTIKESVHYDNCIFPEVMNYHMRNVKLQFDNCVNDAIMQSNGKWVLIDLYSLLSSNTFIYKDLVYTDFQRTISTKLGAKRVSIWGSDSCFGTTTKILESMEAWCDTVLDKYKENIILLNCKLQKEYINDEDIISSFFNGEAPYSVRNEQAENIFQFLKGRLNCYTIDITDSFLADELGYSGKGAVHYELEFYRIVSNKIWFIVNNKPDVKHYATYSGKVRVAQLARLMKRNPILKIKEYYHNIIDSLVLQMPLEVVQDNADKIAEIYDCFWSKIEQYDEDSLRKSILERFDLSENLDLHRSITISGLEKCREVAK